MTCDTHFFTCAVLPWWNFPERKKKNGGGLCCVCVHVPTVTACALFCAQCCERNKNLHNPRICCELTGMVGGGRETQGGFQYGSFKGRGVLQKRFSVQLFGSHRGCRLLVDYVADGKRSRGSGWLGRRVAAHLTLLPGRSLWVLCRWFGVVDGYGRLFPAECIGMVWRSYRGKLIGVLLLFGGCLVEVVVFIVDDGMFNTQHGCYQRNQGVGVCRRSNMPDHQLWQTVGLAYGNYRSSRALKKVRWFRCVASDCLEAWETFPSGFLSTFLNTDGVFGPGFRFSMIIYNKVRLSELMRNKIY